jgi:single stranded DNA-binding protein
MAGKLGRWSTSLASSLAPGGLSACLGVHRPLVPRAGQTARPGTRKRHTITEASVSFAGDLTDQPEIRHTESGIAHATFRVAVSGRREQQPSLLTVIVWRDQAEHAAESLSKGSRVVVMGRLQQRTWTAEDGSAPSVVEVVAEELGPSSGGCGKERIDIYKEGPRPRRRRPGRREAGTGSQGRPVDATRAREACQRSAPSCPCW